MASVVEELPVSGRRQVWSVGCGSVAGGCDSVAIAGIAASGSSDVFVRAATDQERQQPQYATLAAFVILDDDERAASIQEAVKVSVDADSKLHTLFLGEFPGGSDIEVVLLRPNAIQRVNIKGSGDVTVGDNVLAATGSVAITVAASSSVFVTSTDEMDLTRLDIETQGSGDVQVSLGHLQAADVTVTTASSGDITFFTESAGVSATAAVTATGSGDLCWSTNQDVNIASLQVAGLSSADITIAATQVSSALCGKLAVQSVGHSSIDVGSVRCATAAVDSFGSSDIVVQASAAITGEEVGSGSIRYAGAAPQSMGHSYSGSLLAKPVRSSYHSPTCTQQTVRPYSGDDNVLLSGPVGGGAAAIGGGGVGTPPSTVPAGPDEPSPSPASRSEPGHLGTLLPLGLVALIAALALWRFNRGRKPRRLPLWNYDSGAGYDHVASSNAEKQPLVSESRPVYI
jgi:hypothetical protein